MELRAESTAVRLGMVARSVPAGMDGAEEEEEGEETTTRREEEVEEVEEGGSSSSAANARSSRISIASETVTPASLRNRLRDSRGDTETEAAVVVVACGLEGPFWRRCRCRRGGAIRLGARKKRRKAFGIPLAAAARSFFRFFKKTS